MTDREKCWPGGPKHDWIPDDFEGWVCDRCGYFEAENDFPHGHPEIDPGEPDE